MVAFYLPAERHFDFLHFLHFGITFGFCDPPPKKLKMYITFLRFRIERRDKHHLIHFDETNRILFVPSLNSKLWAFFASDWGYGWREESFSSCGRFIARGRIECFLSRLGGIHQMTPPLTRGQMTPEKLPTSIEKNSNRFRRIPSGRRVFNEFSYLRRQAENAH